MDKATLGEIVLSLDNELANIKDHFPKKSLILAVDGTEPKQLKKITMLKMDNQSEQSLMSPHRPWGHPARERISSPTIGNYQDSAVHCGLSLSFRQFSTDEKAVDAVVRNLEVIAAAVN